MIKTLLLAAAMTGQFLEEPKLHRWVPKGIDLPEIKFFEHEQVFQYLQGRHLGAVPRLFRTNERIAGSLDRTGHANAEFPWKHTAGLEDGMNAKVLRFVHLPGPIDIWREVRPQPGHSANETHPGYVWSFPEGTLFGELLLVTDEDGYDHTFEVRTRQKKNGEWFPKVFIPNMEVKTDRERAFEAKTLTLDLNFKLFNVGKAKAQFLDYASFVPGRHDITTDEWSVVPKGYKGTLTKFNCVACHAQAGLLAKSLDERRHWYGNIRGSDQIFSFSPFEPGETAIMLNKAMIEKGILQPK